MGKEYFLFENTGGVIHVLHFKALPASLLIAGDPTIMTQFMGQ